MILFYSGDGGARSDIPETALDKPAVMLSYFVNVKKGKPDSRFRALLKAKRAQEKKK